MNKKIAALLFAVGLGATASQAIGASCGWDCLRAYQACVKNGTPELDCELDRLDCYDRCGI
jgi:hypothetical protein